MNENNMIYGVDISKNFTPAMVRDAIIQCFYEAHSNVLDLAKEYFDLSSDEDFEVMKKEQVSDLVETIFKTSGGDFDNPDKTALTNVVNTLRKIAELYREPDVINHNVNQIMKLINKLD